MRRNVWWRVLLAVVAVAYVVWTVSGPKDATDDRAQPEPSTTTSVAQAQTPSAGKSTDTSLAGLPAQVGQTLKLIEAGGPYPYSRDDTVFMNRERRLPQQPRGYWREYTVPTPGSSDRGARRIVRGRDGETYYTADHYRTFKRLDVGSR